MKRLFLIAAASVLLASPALAQQGSGEEHRDLDTPGVSSQQTTVPAPARTAPSLSGTQGSQEEHRDLDTPGVGSPTTGQAPAIRNPATPQKQGSDEEHRDLDTPGVRSR
jgi:hypothetical protein